MVFKGLSTMCGMKVFFKSVLIFLLVNGSFLFSHPSSYALPDCYGVPLDKKLSKFLNFKNGFFIEAGANDGITQSNTKLLEECYGWKGILIEPSPNLFSTLISNRPNSKCFQCALGSFQEDNTYLTGDFDGKLMSSVNGVKGNRRSSIKVVTRSLQSILDECDIRHVNFFSLDTEGYEFNVLKGIDFEKTSFDYMLIEINFLHYTEIVHFLASKGYEMIENFSKYNRLTNPLWDGTHNDYLFKKTLN